MSLHQAGLLGPAWHQFSVTPPGKTGTHASTCHQGRCCAGSPTSSIPQAAVTPSTNCTPAPLELTSHRYQILHPPRKHLWLPRRCSKPLTPQHGQGKGLTGSEWCSWGTLAEHARRRRAGCSAHTLTNLFMNGKAFQSFPSQFPCWEELAGRGGLPRLAIWLRAGRSSAQRHPSIVYLLVPVFSFDSVFFLCSKIVLQWRYLL